MTPASVASTDSETPAPRRRTSSRALVGLLVVALVAGGAWWLLNLDDAPAPITTPRLLGAGERVAEHVEQRGTASFKLPDGRDVAVAVSVGVQTDAGARAPREGRVVEVSWTAGPNPTSDYRVRENIVRQPAGLSLGVAGRTLKVGEVVTGFSPRTLKDEPDGRQVLQVPGDGTRLRVQLAYAGRSQAMELFTGRREAGSFRSLYRPVPSSRANILSTQRVNDTAGVTWRSYLDAQWFRTPYVADRGWAAQGHEWLVVSGPELVVQSATKETPQGDLTYAGQPGVAPGGVRVWGGRLVTDLPRSVTTGTSVRDSRLRFSRLLIEVPSGGAVDVELWFEPTLYPWSRPDGAPIDGVRFARTLSVPVEADLA